MAAQSELSLSLHVAFYDEAGARTYMSNGVVSKIYQIDSLQRIITETHLFNNPTQSFTLSYEYNLASQVKKITDAMERQRDL